MFKKYIKILIVLSLSAAVINKDINKVQEFVEWMLNDCDQDVFELYTHATLRYKSKSNNDTWILMKGRGGLPGYSVPFDNAMGLLYFTQPIVEDTDIQGTYIYPDWATCVKGTWKNYILQNGNYCKIKNSSILNGKTLAIESEEIDSSPELKYFPPNYNCFGKHTTLRDAFEINSVEVRGTSMWDIDTSTDKDQGEGLFVIRNIRQGEVICFFSGRIVHQGHLHLLHRRQRSKAERMHQGKYGLYVHSEQQNFAVIDIPPRYGNYQAYRTTQGHKVNHSFHPNSEFQPFYFHPVLGFIMAVVAVKDISKGSEVFCNYDYKDSDSYEAIGIFPGSLECYLGKCHKNDENEK